MRKSLAVFLLAAFTALSADQLIAAFIPPIGLAPGSQYQLVFVTAGTHDATSANIADYNAFVTAEAALNPALPAGLTWRAVASTPTVDANVNAPSVGLPVYNTVGLPVATAATGLYSQALVSPIDFTQFGTLDTYITDGAPHVWTGGTYNGTPNGTSNALGPGFALGGPFGRSVQGLAPSNFDSWALDTIQSQSELVPLYALSSPITVVPEPSSVILAAVALLAVVAYRIRRR